jgi:hypothetical protein
VDGLRPPSLTTGPVLDIIVPVSLGQMGIQENRVHLMHVKTPARQRHRILLTSRKLLQRKVQDLKNDLPRPWVAAKPMHGLLQPASPWCKPCASNAALMVGWAGSGRQPRVGE